MCDVVVIGREIGGRGERFPRFVTFADLFGLHFARQHQGFYSEQILRGACVPKEVRDLFQLLVHPLILLRSSLANL